MMDNFQFWFWAMVLVLFIVFYIIVNFAMKKASQWRERRDEWRKWGGY